MIAIKIGTVSWRQTQVLAADEVEFTGVWQVNPTDSFESYMVWDAGLNNARAMTAPEIAALPAQKLIAAHPSIVALLSGAGTNELKITRAMLLMLLDELNLHKDKFNAILNAIDASTNYATLKTNIAAVADYPTRTKAQLVEVMKNKINAGDADV